MFIEFSCLDSKSDRDDYDSRKVLTVTIKESLEDTNWRLMSDGISYRLGYLTGRLRAHESQDDIRELVMKSRKLKEKKPMSTQKSKQRSMKDNQGREIIF